MDDSIVLYECVKKCRGRISECRGAMAISPRDKDTQISGTNIIAFQKDLIVGLRNIAIKLGYTDENYLSEFNTEDL